MKKVNLGVENGSKFDGKAKEYELSEVKNDEEEGEEEASKSQGSAKHLQLITYWREKRAEKLSCNEPRLRTLQDYHNVEIRMVVSGVVDT